MNKIWGSFKTLSHNTSRLRLYLITPVPEVFELPMLKYFVIGQNHLFFISMWLSRDIANANSRKGRVEPKCFISR